MRVVIGEDAVLLRAGLVRVLEEAGEEVVAAVGDAPALVDAVTRLSPDVAIADIRMPPDMTDDGLRAAIELRTRRPDSAVLVFSQYVEQAYASELLATGSVGLGYLLKERVADVGQFVEAVRRVAAGGTALNSSPIPMNPPDEMTTATMRPAERSTIRFSTLPSFSSCRFFTGVPITLLAF